MKPIFGQPEAGKTYKTRKGVYTVISREDQIVIVEAPNGACFLPGGEIEGNETHAEALAREMLEELGFVIEIGAYLGEAADYFYSRFRDTYFYNPGYFYIADSWQSVAEPLEKTNKIHWVSVKEALVRLKRGSHRWAVLHWIEKNR